MMRMVWRGGRIESPDAVEDAIDFLKHVRTLSREKKTRLRPVPIRRSDIGYQILVCR